jgi:hypothetical protein
VFGGDLLDFVGESGEFFLWFENLINETFLFLKIKKN